MPLGPLPLPFAPAISGPGLALFGSPSSASWCLDLDSKGSSPLGAAALGEKLCDFSQVLGGTVVQSSPKPGGGVVGKSPSSILRRGFLIPSANRF